MYLSASSTVKSVLLIVLSRATTTRFLTSNTATNDALSVRHLTLKITLKYSCLFFVVSINCYSCVFWVASFNNFKVILPFKFKDKKKTQQNMLTLGSEMYINLLYKFSFEDWRKRKLYETGFEDSVDIYINHI